ncbi:MAG: LPS export ABC transporter permease LptG [Pseudomonadota bacterium]
MTTLDRYIAAVFLRQFLYVFLAVTAVILLIDVIELLRRGAGKDVAFGEIMTLAALRAPHLAEKVAVFAVLFGALSSFFRLTRSQELIVARSSGVSAWRFLAPVLLAAAFIGVVGTTAFNPIASATLARFERIAAAVFDGRADAIVVSDKGLWLRQTLPDGHAVIYARSVSPGGVTLETATVFRFDDEERFVERLDADKGELTPGRWRFDGVTRTAPGQAPEVLARVDVPTDLTVAGIQESFAAPETMSFWALRDFTKALEAAGFSGHRHSLQWHRLVSAPLFMCAMVMIAASFSLRLSRRGGTGKMVLFGILSGFAFYLFSNIVYALGLSGTVPAALAAWTPPGVSLMIGSAAILHLEDG